MMPPTCMLHRTPSWASCPYTLHKSPAALPDSYDTWGQGSTFEHASRVASRPKSRGQPEGQLGLSSWQPSLCCQSGKVVGQRLALWDSTA